MAGGEDDVVRPPEAPPMIRRFRTDPFQLVGLAFIVGIPILALAGVFGMSRAEVAARDGGLELTVRYVDRLRFGQTYNLEILVTNVGRQAFDTLTVSIDPAYLHGFINATWTPSPTQAHKVDLAGPRPGEGRLIVIALRADRYGRHTGAVAATAGGDTARVVLSTLVFP
jgi:hypothetical protein